MGQEVIENYTGQEVIEISWVRKRSKFPVHGSGGDRNSWVRKRTKFHGSGGDPNFMGPLGSDQDVFKSHGTDQVTLSRSDRRKDIRTAKTPENYKIGRARNKLSPCTSIPLAAGR